MYCEDCGCKVYSGHCVNCHEETFIAEQNYQNEEPIAFSDNFKEKLKVQKEEAIAFLDNFKKKLKVQKEEDSKLI